jgi:taurine dioxygenase
MTTIEARPMTSAIGAEISGLDLREPLAPGTIAAIEELLHEHLLLVFRDMDITPEQLLAFARAFGPVSLPPVAPCHPDHPDLMVVETDDPRGKGADIWHTDAPWMPEPPAAAILKAERLPGVGGDTCFASMCAAYEDLSPPFQRLLDGLEAVHDITAPLRKAIDNGISRNEFEEMRRRWPPVAHPIVRTHPHSGRRALFVTPNSVTHVVGIPSDESALLLRLLFEHVRSPDFQCRLHWEPHTIAFWDQRCVQHYAVPDYRERRVMLRATIDGDRPF